MEDGAVGPHILLVEVIVRGPKLEPATILVHQKEAPTVREQECTPTHALGEAVQVIQGQIFKDIL